MMMMMIIIIIIIIIISFGSHDHFSKPINERPIWFMFNFTIAYIGALNSWIYDEMCCSDSYVKAPCSTFIQISIFANVWPFACYIGVR